MEALLVEAVSKSGFRMSRRIKHQVETVSTMEFISDSKRPGENMNFAKNSPTTRIACFIGCSHSKRQLQFCIKNPMIKNKIPSGSTIGWNCQTVEPTVTLPLKKSKLGTKWENSVSGGSKSGFRKSRRIKHLVEALCKMVLKSNSSRQKKTINSAQNNTTIRIDNPAIRIDNGTIRIACFIGLGQGKRQTWSCANHRMISCEKFSRKYIVSSSQRRANSDIPDEKKTN